MLGLDIFSGDCRRSCDASVVGTSRTELNNGPEYHRVRTTAPAEGIKVPEEELSERTLRVVLQELQDGDKVPVAHAGQRSCRRFLFAFSSEQFFYGTLRTVWRSIASVVDTSLLQNFGRSRIQVVNNGSAVPQID